jgi:deazaflavin-dependent oxidoreductase (nitroreductase family)
MKLFNNRGLDRRLSPVGVWLMRRTKGRLASYWDVNALVLTTQGRRSGRDRTVILQYFPDGEAMVVIAANDGGERHPGWFYNLTASPNAVVEVDGRRVPVHATQLGPEEASQWWQRVLLAAPDYELYRRATSRPFPIMRLVPLSERGETPV